MGRVKRYKKVKAMDPFAKGGGGGKMGRKNDDLDRNLPPDLKNHQAQRLNNLEGDGKNKKKMRRRLPQWAHDELKETAKRVREEHADPEGKARQHEAQRPTMEGKREDESMRQFNKRVREGTAQLLKDEFKEHSSTNKRRKKYLDDKKRMNKLKKQGLWEEVKRRERYDEETAAEGGEEGRVQEKAPGGRGRRGGGGSGGANAGSSGGGDTWGAQGRADDEAGMAYPEKERIRFGDVAHAPPDLAKIPKPRGFKDQGQVKPWARRAVGTEGGDTASGGKSKQQQQQQIRKAAGGEKMGGKEGDEEGEEDEAGQERRQLEAEATKAQKRQMEEMRLRVQEAYNGLKKKRRAGQTQYVGSDL